MPGSFADVKAVMEFAAAPSRGLDANLIVHPTPLASTDNPDEDFFGMDFHSGVSSNNIKTSLTAARVSEKPGAEALSGSRAPSSMVVPAPLLVSHREVNSYATIKLITKAFEEIKTDPKLAALRACGGLRSP